MDLSVREVATLLGRSSRTVRAQLARGELAGVKRNGRWRVARQSLPLTEAQRRSLQGKADALRQTVEDVFPSGRARDLAEADRAMVRLRVLLRVAQDLGLLSPAGLRFACGRLQTAGRMVGGWRKRVEGVQSRAGEDPAGVQISGDGSPAAAGA
ncbi:MAG TPA: helix-turn-helix domain-containing protein [Thermoanaerobaculia bacterium]|jgi:hypothetical protein